MRKFLLLALLLPALAHAQSIATCASAASGTNFASGWLPCAPPALYVPAANLTPASPVATQRNVAGTYTNAWMSVASLATGDRVWASAPDPATGSAWWSIAHVTFGSGGGGGGLTVTLSKGYGTLSWFPPTKNTDGSPVAPGELTGYNAYSCPTAACTVTSGTLLNPAPLPATSSASCVDSAGKAWPYPCFHTAQLAPGTYYFGVVARTASTSSTMTVAGPAVVPVITATITPNAPGTMTFSYTVTSP